MKPVSRASTPLNDAYPSPPRARKVMLPTHFDEGIGHYHPCQQAIGGKVQVCADDGELCLVNLTDN